MPGLEAMRPLRWRPTATGRPAACLTALNAAVAPWRQTADALERPPAVVEVHMDAQLNQKILPLLETHRIMPIATLRPDGWPEATTVGYVHEA